MQFILRLGRKKNMQIILYVFHLFIYLNNYGWKIGFFLFRNIAFFAKIDAEKMYCHFTLTKPKKKATEKNRFKSFFFKT